MAGQSRRDDAVSRRSVQSAKRVIGMTFLPEPASGPSGESGALKELQAP